MWLQNARAECVSPADGIYPQKHLLYWCTLWDDGGASFDKDMMLTNASSLKFLEDRWDEATAATLDPADLLRYRSNLLGSDLRITNFGGGNTSSKLDEIDPVTGDSVEGPLGEGLWRRSRQHQAERDLQLSTLIACSLSRSNTRASPKKTPWRPCIRW